MSDEELAKVRAGWQQQTADWAMKRAQYRKREKMDRELIDSLTADRDSLRAALEQAQPYCTRYGVYLPAGEFTNGYTAHNECPPTKHVLVISRQALTSSEKEKERA